MSSQNSFWTPFWHGGMAAIILIVGAFGLYFHIYLPARLVRENLEQTQQSVLTRQADKQRQLAAVREKTREIASGDPETVKETMRVEILKGGKNEFTGE